MVIFEAMQRNQPAAIKVCADDKRLYGMVRFRIEQKIMNLDQAIRLLRSELVDKEYFDLIGREDFIRSVKLN